MLPSAAFPTPLHQEVAAAIVGFFQQDAAVDAVLLVNSCARGCATPDSDLDLAILVAVDLAAPAAQTLAAAWERWQASSPLVARFRQAGQWTGIHLDLITGQYAPELWDDGGGPDGFELEIGNQVAYSQPLWAATAAFAVLQTRWLPYYDDALQRQRLDMVRAACHNDLDHIPFYQRRGLPFQAFDRLYRAFQEFLQALFIAHRVYPIAYNKWIHEQVAVRLGRPELYAQLPAILELRQFEGAAILDNAARLRALVELWTTPRSAGD